MNEAPAIGIIGGSGLYDIEGFSVRKEEVIDTPFGAPSDPVLTGVLEGRRVCFIARHGKGHRILPTEINHRANIYALKQLNVRWVIAVTAVGSLKEEYHPREIVLPDQFYDRTSRREHHTFFGEGIVAHVGFSDPISKGLQECLAMAAEKHEVKVHRNGTYVCMDGPAFSTRAESLAYRQLGFDIIGMTNLPEAKLAREAEMALATLAMVTDYDCWKTDEEPVSVETLLGHLNANADLARKILKDVIPMIPKEADWSEHFALQNALVTPKVHWPRAAVEKLQPLLSRFL